MFTPLLPVNPCSSPAARREITRFFWTAIKRSKDGFIDISNAELLPLGLKLNYVLCKRGPLVTTIVALIKRMISEERPVLSLDKEQSLTFKDIPNQDLLSIKNGSSFLEYFEKHIPNSEFAVSFEGSVEFGFDLGKSSVILTCPNSTWKLHLTCRDKL